MPSVAIRRADLSHGDPDDIWALLLGESRPAFGWMRLAALALVSAGIWAVNRRRGIGSTRD
ncbi:hypothetical protein [Pseudoramibacter faecis]|uniref:hypothetical protein n=1 Tax=Pseudoramibacter faecis TaxID=3108534 RepID=UPI002E791D2A|nr:hypothetical protein [Pseudoramibacter sp. HA2172]